MTKLRVKCKANQGQVYFFKLTTVNQVMVLYWLRVFSEIITNQQKCGGAFLSQLGLAKSVYYICSFTLYITEKWVWDVCNLKNNNFAVSSYYLTGHWYSSFGSFSLSHNHNGCIYILSYLYCFKKHYPKHSFINSKSLMQILLY